MSDDIRTSSTVVNTRKEYEEWSKKHTTMKAQPPKDGRDYIRHARNLIPLLEGVSELHPFAKAIVFTFKAVVMFEHDRRENEARVTSVFLAQTDMMRVLLNLDDLYTRRRGYFDSDEPEPEDLHKELMDRISDDIKDCGNSIDTYYKESRIVKFFQAEEWKQRILGYVDTFNKHRHSLLQTLQFQVAAGVDDLNFKMDFIIKSLFDQKYDWEKKVAAQTRQLGHRSRWMNNTKVLGELVKISSDHQVDPSVFNPTSSKPSHPSASDNSAAAASNLKSNTMNWNEHFIENIKEELAASLSDLCERNKALFETKLNFHAKRIKDAISKSAQSIIRELSGPYDRLDHEDLRELWKEMNWIFCVDNRLFALALFEYYLDKVSSYDHKSVSSEGDSNDPPTPTKTIASPRGQDVQKLKHAPHPDAWTLEFISAYGSRITKAIDCDDSGFIRISEANEFTTKIPKGWNLPEWCAYHAIGWFYEIRIYQMRMNEIFRRMCELQISALPANRFYMVHEIAGIIGLFFPLSRHIEGTEIVNPPNEMCLLVKDKVAQQDKQYRDLLQPFKFTMDSASTIHLIFQGQPLESYILPFATLLLEHWLSLMEICSEETLDIREWNWVEITISHVRDLILGRVLDLTDQFAVERGPSKANDDLKNYHGGIYSHFYRQFFRDDTASYTYDDIEAFINNISLINDFPLGPAPADISSVLKYKTWEEYLSHSNMGNPDQYGNPPPAFGDPDEDPKEIPRGKHFAERDQIPQLFHGDVWCNHCGPGSYIAEQARYKCLDCDDVDLCTSCYHNPAAANQVEGHSASHTVLKLSIHIPSPLLSLIENLAKYQEIKHSSNMQFQDSPSAVTHVECMCCPDAIDVQSTFYACIGHTCDPDRFICSNCVDAEARDEDGHQPWHTVLVLSNLKFGDDEADDGDSFAPHNDSAGGTSQEANVSARLNDLETRMKALESRVDSGITEIKSMFEKLLSGMAEKPTSVQSRGLPAPGVRVPAAVGPPSQPFGHVQQVGSADAEEDVGEQYEEQLEQFEDQYQEEPEEPEYQQDDQEGFQQGDDDGYQGYNY